MADPVLRLYQDEEHALLLAGDPTRPWYIQILDLQAACECLTDLAEGGEFVVPTTMRAAEEIGLPFYANLPWREPFGEQGDDGVAVPAAMLEVPAGEGIGTVGRLPDEEAIATVLPRDGSHPR